MRHPWLVNTPEDVYEPKTAKHRTYQKYDKKLLRDHEKICEHLTSLATTEEITDALKTQKFNFITGNDRDFSRASSLEVEKLSFLIIF